MLRTGFFADNTSDGGRFSRFRHDAAMSTGAQLNKTVQPNPSTNAASLLPDQLLQHLKATFSSIMAARQPVSLLSDTTRPPETLSNRQATSILHYVTSHCNLTPAILVSLVRYYSYRPDALTQTERLLLLACSQYVLGGSTVSTSIPQCLRMAQQTLTLEQTVQSSCRMAYVNSMTQVVLTLEQESNLDLSLLLQSLLLEYSSLYQGCNMFYAQKLLDYVWCRSKGPSLGALTLSTIGPSPYTFHKPLFNNSLAVFFVCHGNPNTVLCDPIQLSTYSDLLTQRASPNQGAKSVLNAEAQLEYIATQERKSAVYSYTDCLSTLHVLPSVYLNPLIATGNMTHKALATLRDSFLYSGDTILEDPGADTDIFDFHKDDAYSHAYLRRQASMNSLSSFSSLLNGIKVVRAISLVSNSNLYAYSGRFFIAEHMEPFPLGCCLPGMAWKLAVFHGFPASQTKATEKYVVQKFYSGTPEIFLVPTPWENDGTEDTQDMYSLPRRMTVSTMQSGQYAMDHDYRDHPLSDIIEQDHVCQLDALEACSFSLSDSNKASTDMNLSEKSDFNDDSSNMSQRTAQVMINNMNMSFQVGYRPDEDQAPSFFGDEMYFCNASQCNNSSLRTVTPSLSEYANVHGMGEKEEGDAGYTAKQGQEQRQHQESNNYTFPSVYREAAIPNEMSSQCRPASYSAVRNQVAEVQKQLYSDLVANELTEEVMYLPPPVLKSSISKTDNIPDSHLLTKCMTGRYSYAKRAVFFLVGPHGHVPCCFYGQRNRFLLVKNREKLYTRTQHERDSTAVNEMLSKRQISNEDIIKLQQQQQQRALLRPFLSTPRVNDPNITPTPVNLLRNKDVSPKKVNQTNKADNSDKGSNNKSKMHTSPDAGPVNLDSKAVPLFRTQWVLRELPTVALLGQMHPLPSFSMQQQEKKHIRRVQAVKFAEYRDKIAAARGEFDDSEAVRHLDKRVMKQALVVSDSEEEPKEKERSSTRGTPAAPSAEAVEGESSSLSDTSINGAREEQPLTVNTETDGDIPADIYAEAETLGDELVQSQRKASAPTVGFYRKGAMHQCDTISHVLSTWNIENFIKRRILYMFDRLVYEHPSEMFTRSSLSDICADMYKFLFKEQYIKELCKYLIFNSRYFILSDDSASIKRLTLKSYADPIEILMFENVISTGSFIDNFMRKTSAETYLLQAVVSESRPGSFLLDRFIGWARLILSYYTDYRASYLQAIRDMRFLLTYSHADIAGVLSFGTRRLKYGADIAGVENIFKTANPGKEQYDMLFRNRMHKLPYSMQQKESIISMLDNVYNVISPSLAGSTFYPMEKVYISPYPSIGLYARFIKMTEASITEEVASLQVSEEKLKQYIQELSSLEPPMTLPNVICHAKMMMQDKEKTASKPETVLETLRVFGVAIYEVLAFIDMVIRTKEVLNLDRNMFSVLESGRPSEFLVRYRLYMVACEQKPSRSVVSSQKAEEKKVQDTGDVNNIENTEKGGKRKRSRSSRNAMSPRAVPDMQPVQPEPEEPKEPVEPAEFIKRPAKRAKSSKNLVRKDNLVQSDQEAVTNVTNVNKDTSTGNRCRSGVVENNQKSNILAAELKDLMTGSTPEQLQKQKEDKEDGCAQAASEQEAGKERVRVRVKRKRRRRKTDLSENREERHRHRHRRRSSSKNHDTKNYNDKDQENNVCISLEALSFIPQTAHFPTSLAAHNDLGSYINNETTVKEIKEQEQKANTVEKETLNQAPKTSKSTPKLSAITESELYAEFFCTPMSYLLHKYSYFLDTEEGKHITADIKPIAGAPDVAMLSTALGRKIAPHIHPIDVYLFFQEISSMGSRSKQQSAQTQQGLPKITLSKYVFNMIELLSRACITVFLTQQQMATISLYQLSRTDRLYRERDMFLEIKMHKQADFLEGKHNGVIDDTILKTLNEPSERVLVESVFGDGKKRSRDRHRIALGEIPCYLYTDSPFLSIQALGHSVQGGEIRGNYFGGLILNQANGCRCIPDLNIVRYSGSFNALTYELAYVHKFLVDEPESDPKIDPEIVPENFQQSFLMHTATSKSFSRTCGKTPVSPLSYMYHILFPLQKTKTYMTNAELTKRIEKYRSIWTHEQNRAFLQLSLPMVQLTSFNRLGTLLVFPHSSFKRLRSLSILLSPTTFSSSIGRSKEIILKQKSQYHLNTAIDAAFDRYQYVINHIIENRTQVELIFDYWTKRRHILSYGNIMEWIGGYRLWPQASVEFRKYPFIHAPELSPAYYVVCCEHMVIVHNISACATHYADFSRGNMNLALANSICDNIYSHKHLFPLVDCVETSIGPVFPTKGLAINIIAAPGDSLQALQVTAAKTHLEAIVSKTLKYEEPVHVVKLVSKIGAANTTQLEGTTALNAGAATAGSAPKKVYDLDEQSIFQVLNTMVPEIYNDLLDLARVFYSETLEIVRTDTKSNVYAFEDPLLLQAVTPGNARGIYEKYTSYNAIYYTKELFKTATDAVLTREDIHHAPVEVHPSLIPILQYNDSIEACAYDCMLNFLQDITNEDSRNTMNQRIAQVFGKSQCIDRGSRRGDLERFSACTDDPVFIVDVYEEVNRMELQGVLPTIAFFYMIRTLYKAAVDYLSFYLPENSIVYGSVVATEAALEKVCASTREAIYGVFLPIVGLVGKIRSFFQQFWRRFGILAAAQLYTKTSSTHIYGGFIHKRQMFSLVFITIWQLEHLYYPLYSDMLAEDILLLSFRRRSVRPLKELRAIKK